MDGYIADRDNLSEPEVSTKLEALDIEWQIFFIILYSLTSILALFENLIVIFVQIFGKSYDLILRICLINLAFADICVGVLSVPFLYTDFMLGRWIFPHFLCPVSQFTILLTVFVTCHTLTLISFERYISIVHPIFHSTHSQQIQSFLAVVLIIGWVLGGILSGISLKFSQILEFQFNGHVFYDCRTTFDSDLTEKSYVLSIFIFTFVLPLVMQSTFHTLIANKLRTLGGTVSQAKVKIIKMLLILVIMFAICWLPIRLFFLILIFNKHLLDLKTRTQYNLYVFTYFVSHFLSMFNSCVNPIIYCFMSKAFREDFMRLFNKLRGTPIGGDTRLEVRAIFNSSSNNID